MDIALYEKSRILAVLFFYQALLERNMCRQLQDLCCMFNHKEFTKEMKEVVGGSKPGLEKFLRQFPLLFKILDDYVKIKIVKFSPFSRENNHYKSAGTPTVKKRAIQYLSSILIEYGKSNELPIHILFQQCKGGEPSVRKAMGRTQDKFKRFLLGHSDRFVVSDTNQTVMLKDYNDSIGGLEESQTLLNVLAKYFDLQEPIDSVVKERLTRITPKILQNTKEESRRILFHQPHNTSKIALFPNAHIVSSMRKCKKITDRILCEARVNSVLYNSTEWPFTSGRVFIGVSCEGVNMEEDGQITLIQIATMHGQVYLFDVLYCDVMINAGLKEMLESPEVVKVMYDCCNVAVSLYKQFNIMLCSVFDTQAAAAIISTQQTNRPIYEFKSITVHHFYELYKVPLYFSEALSKDISKDKQHWTKRPLSQEMIDCAAAIAIGLVHEHLYPAMSQFILPHNRKLMLDICSDQVLTHIAPNIIKVKEWQRKKENDMAAIQAEMFATITNIIADPKGMSRVQESGLPLEERRKLKAYFKADKKLRKRRYGRTIKPNCLTNPIQSVHSTSNVPAVNCPDAISHSSIVNPFNGNSHTNHNDAAPHSSSFTDPYSGASCSCHDCHNQ